MASLPEQVRRQRPGSGIASADVSDEHQIWSIGLDWLPQPIAVLSNAGMVVYCNRAWLAHRQSNLGGWFLDAFAGSSHRPEARTDVDAARHSAIRSEERRVG